MSNKLVTLGYYSSITEAHVVRALLEDSGLFANLVGEELNMGYSFLATPAGGYEIQVPEEDLERAKQLLDEAKNTE
jgi:Putative prokaryotic signal transducing protein